MYDPYKLIQLQNMFLAEQSPETSGYGANLTHWSGRAKPINIDAGAIQTLIDYYSIQENALQEYITHTMMFVT